MDGEICKACGVPLPLLPPRPSIGKPVRRDAPGEVGVPGKAAVPITAIMADQAVRHVRPGVLHAGLGQEHLWHGGSLDGQHGAAPQVLNGLTASVGWTVDSVTDYEAEGVVFHSGQTIQWLRDKLGALKPEDDIEALARSAPDNGGVYIVPAFAGICAPRTGCATPGRGSSA